MIEYERRYRCKIPQCYRAEDARELGEAVHHGGLVGPLPPEQLKLEEEEAVEQEEDDEYVCSVCQSTADAESMLLCDGCDAAAHVTCAGLAGVPEGDWFCNTCAPQHNTAAAAEYHLRSPAPATCQE